MYPRRTLPIKNQKMIQYHILLLPYMDMYLASKSQCKNLCECSCEVCQQLKFFFKKRATKNHHCPKRHHYWLLKGSNSIYFPKSFNLSMKESVSVWSCWKPSAWNHKEVWVRELLHIHSGIGYFVTALLPLSSGCPKESMCNSFMMLLNSASGREEFKK